eukprot:gene5837-5751_t
MARSVTVGDTQLPVFSDEEAAAAMVAKGMRAEGNYGCMYSSYLGGFTQNPGFMAVPLDDHMIVRGHAVFDVLAMDLLGLQLSSLHL